MLSVVFVACLVGLSMAQIHHPQPGQHQPGGTNEHYYFHVAGDKLVAKHGQDCYVYQLSSEVHSVAEMTKAEAELLSLVAQYNVDHTHPAHPTHPTHPTHDHHVRQAGHTHPTHSTGEHASHEVQQFCRGHHMINLN